MSDARPEGRVRAVLGLLIGSSVALAPAASVYAQQPPQSRQIEEIMVTAERRQASISDTSISITAIDADFISDFGLRNQEDLQNFIPATTIQPYDVTIRGIGRTARTLGGDPGVATYFNGVYSEDFGIASTEGGLFDLERIEVLRGPQGTLYGRNAVGGAMNFISKRPTNEYEIDAQTTVGNFGTFEFSGILSGPIIEDVLKARFTYTNRTRDGYIKDTSPFNNDINDYGDENFALAFEFTPTDRLSFYLRGNTRDFDRKFNGGAGTSPIATSQEGLAQRNTTDLAFGWRPTPEGQTPDRMFTHPVTGAAVAASRIRPGIDPNSALNADGMRDAHSATDTLPNYAFGLSQSRAHIFDPGSTDASDFLVDTNGQYEELFDHSAVQFNANYDADNWSLSYTFGYTDFLYERTTDEDKTGNTLLGSYDFYVNQKNYNWQHEIQLNFDIGDSISLTTGAFAYQSVVDQRLDLYDPIDVQGRFQDGAPIGTLSPGLVGALLGGADFSADDDPIANPFRNQELDIFSAKAAFRSGEQPLGINGSTQLFAPWFGQQGTNLRQGPATDGTFFAWDNTVDTRAYAIYGQGTWDINEQWSLTGGLRYARDEKDGQERLFTILEIAPDDPTFGGLALLDPATIGFLFDGDETTAPSLAPQVFQAFADPACAASTLCQMNVASGSMVFNPETGQIEPVGPDGPAVRFNGAPVAFSSYLPVDDTWDVWTWRVNLDYAPAPGQLIYLSATTGWKSGGFNLGFNSVNNPIFGEEDVLAFELGYKGRLLDGAMQLNTSVYYYDFDNRQTFSTIQGQFGTGAAVVNIPDSQVWGIEADVFWLATDNLTLGGNGSFTRATFESFLPIIDNANPNLPGTLFTPEERTVNVDGNRLPLIPDWKFSAFANYTWRLDQAGSIDLRSSLSWTDGFFTTVFNDSELDKTPSFTRWDARLSWTSVDQAWNVAAFVNNILDEAGVRSQQAQTEREGGFLRTVTTTDPRVYGVTLRWSWAN